MGKKEILCGVSTRTNLEGVKQLQAAFPDYVVTPIPIPAPEEGGLLHLITHCSRYAPGPYLAIGKSAASQKVKKTIQEKAVSKVEFFEVPDDWASNCIFCEWICAPLQRIRVSRLVQGVPGKIL